MAALIASTVVGALTDAWPLPQELRAYLAADHVKGPQVWDAVVVVLGLPGLVVGIIALIGLYRFRPTPGGSL
jgi:hypothetical protein